MCCGAIFFLIVRNYKVEVNRSAGVFGRGSLRSLLPPHTSPHDKFRPKITARMPLKDYFLLLTSRLLGEGKIKFVPSKCVFINCVLIKVSLPCK